MREHRFKETKTEDGVIGTLEDAVPDGHGGKMWEEDMKSYMPFSDLATKQFVNSEIATVIGSMNMSENDGDITVSYEED